MPRQDSLADQLSDLVKYANEQGMYDASDWVQNKWLGPETACMNTWCVKGMYHRGNCEADFVDV